MLHLVLIKHAAYGTDSFESLREKCSLGLYEEYMKYVGNTRDEPISKKSQGKKWWSMSKTLLLQKQSVSGIPPLKCNDGTWVFSPGAKADLFVSCMSGKFVLPTIDVNEYTNKFNDSSEVMSGFLPIRERWTRRNLQRLKVDSGTGPDLLSTKVLKNCAASLACAITIIARKILDTGEWPSGWKFHWVYPLYKRKCKGDPGNYRGIHLTAQVSKVVERTIGELFLPFLEIINAARPN